MLQTSMPTSGLIFISFLYRGDEFEEAALLEKFSQTYGPLISMRPTQNPLKEYYAKEMGPADLLKRVFALTTTLYPRELLLTIKLQSLEWERGWSRSGKRTVNVDVGFLSLENFTLATTKNYAHRIYLGQNIFADLTYQFIHQKFEFLPWTYPDYRDEEKVEFFTWGRSFLLQKL